MSNTRKLHACMIPAIVVFALALFLCCTAPSHAASGSADEQVGLMIMGDGVKGTAGFQGNIIYLTEEEKEALKVNKNPSDYGLGDSWAENRRYSSYDDHGTGGYHYSIADGIDLLKLLDATVQGGSASIESIWIDSIDGYSTSLLLNSITALKYYAPGDRTGVASDDPMIAFYKTTTETDDPDSGVEPTGPAEKLVSGKETYVYGQSRLKDDNNCHFIKGTNTVIVGAKSFSYIKSDCNKYISATLKQIIDWGIWEENYVIVDSVSTATHKVNGVPLAVFNENVGLDDYIPDDDNAKLVARSTSGETMQIRKSEIENAFIAWDYYDDMETPAEQTNCLALYMTDSKGQDHVLYNLANIYAVDAEGNTVTTKQTTPTPDPEPATETKLSKPTLKLTAGKKKVTVKWSKVANADGYKIYRSTKKSKGYKCIKTVKSGKTVKYINKKLKKGKKYYYKMRAYKKSDSKTIYSKYSAVKAAKAK